MATRPFQTSTASITNGCERELVRPRIELRQALVQDVARDPCGVPAAAGDEHRRERVQERQPAK